MMLSKITIISKDILYGITLCFFILYFSITSLIIYRLTFIIIITFGHICITAIEFISQSFKRRNQFFEINFGITVYINIPLTAFGISSSPHQRIGKQSFTVHRINAIAAVFFIHFCIRRHSLSHQKVNTSTVTVMRYYIGISSHLHIISHIHINIRTNRVTFVVEPFQHTFLTHIVGRNVILHIIRPTADTYVMVLDDTSLRYSINPIILYTIGLIFCFVCILHIVIIHGFSGIL